MLQVIHARYGDPLPVSITHPGVVELERRVGVNVEHSGGGLKADWGCGDGLGGLGRIPRGEPSWSGSEWALLFERHERRRDGSWRRCLGCRERNTVGDRLEVGGSTRSLWNAED